MSQGRPGRIGAVVIGRNEGERLKRCLRSLGGRVEPLIYVDSGSTDDSVEFARSMGAELVALDTSVPFTMARARNAGFDCLVQQVPDIEFVHFVDGDCEVASGWVEKARDYLAAQPDVATVCGYRKEFEPGASLYNRLIDLEWRAPSGDVAACGGDALMRVAAFREVAGYNPIMIAGEEPELCCRLRLAGWRIVRLDAAMTRHDAALYHFSQWWKRALRGGHALAEGAHLQGRTALRHNVRQLRSVAFWGLALPLAIAACLTGACSAWRERRCRHYSVGWVGS